jgi:hypothetical protein
MVAAGVDAMTVGAEVALSAAGAAPKLHAIMAPVTTSCGMIRTPLFETQLETPVFLHRSRRRPYA